MRKLKTEEGQALLLVILIMVVSLTIGLSVVSRSIVNIRTTTEEENSQRALSAAEAGIEQALKTGQGVATAQDLGNNAQIKNVEVEQVLGTSFLLSGGNRIEKDNGLDVWLSSYPDYSGTRWSGDLTIYWGSTTDTCTADSLTNTMVALEVIVISGNRNNPDNPESKRYAYDPCSARRGINNFTEPNSGSYAVQGKNFAYRTPPTGSDKISVSNGFIARVIPLYASTSIGVSGTVALPSQGGIIKSTGSSGGTERKITYFQGYPQLPSEFFQYILFSP